jgi:DeoR/GlpR family transcriptional regulator of sugar metabolism
MRKPINTSVPEDLIRRVDEFVQASQGGYKDRSHLVEQAVRRYLGDDPTLNEPTTKTSSTTASSSLYETSLFPRLAMQTREKKAIAKVAAGLIETGTTIFMDGSTTCIQLAKELTNQRKGLTIISNSALICLELGHSGEHKIIGVGGEYDSSSASFVGSSSEESLEHFYVDFAIFSTKGFIPQDGTYESSMGTLRIKQVAARHCSKVILLADHTKFDQRSLCKVLDSSQIHTVVTDDRTQPESVEFLRQNGHEVLIAGLTDEENTRKARGKEHAA